MNDELDWEKALEHTGALLEYRDAPHANLVVAGGAAMLFQALALRVTRDVDVIGIVQRDRRGRLRILPLERMGPPEAFSYKLPDAVASSAEKTARDLGLDDNWLNAVAADVTRLGLPEGASKRLHPKMYGSKLTISFLDRKDLIPLKLHAALDRGGGRHLDDLRAMNPSPEEIANASRWCLVQDEGLKTIARGALKAMGFEDALDRLDF